MLMIWLRSTASRFDWWPESVTKTLARFFHEVVVDIAFCEIRHIWRWHYSTVLFFGHIEGIYAHSGNILPSTFMIFKKAAVIWNKIGTGAFMATLDRGWCQYSIRN